LSPFDIREGISIKYVIAESTGACSRKALPPHPFLKKTQHFFPFYIGFFFTFQDEIPKKKDITRRDINFLFSFFSVIFF
jgi:hypothetical protein